MRRQSAAPLNQILDSKDVEARCRECLDVPKASIIIKLAMYRCSQGAHCRCIRADALHSPRIACGCDWSHHRCTQVLKLWGVDQHCIAHVDRQAARVWAAPEAHSYCWWPGSCLDLGHHLIHPMDCYGIVPGVHDDGVCDCWPNASGLWSTPWSNWSGTLPGYMSGVLLQLQTVNMCWPSARRTETLDTLSWAYWDVWTNKSTNTNCSGTSTLSWNSCWHLRGPPKNILGMPWLINGNNTGFISGDILMVAYQRDMDAISASREQGRVDCPRHPLGIRHDIHIAICIVPSSIILDGENIALENSSPGCCKIVRLHKVIIRSTCLPNVYLLVKWSSVKAQSWLWRISVKSHTCLLHLWRWRYSGSLMVWYFYQYHTFLCVSLYIAGSHLLFTTDLYMQEICWFDYLDNGVLRST